MAKYFGFTQDENSNYNFCVATENDAEKNYIPMPNITWSEVSDLQWDQFVKENYEVSFNGTSVTTTDSWENSTSEFSIENSTITKDDVIEYIATFKKRIQEYVKGNPSHPELNNWNATLSALENFNLDTITWNVDTVQSRSIYKLLTSSGGLTIKSPLQII
jgi:hypothetical protein